MIDPYEAGLQADDLTKAEVERQDKMWGVANERADSNDGQLLRAGIAQLDAVLARRRGSPAAFTVVPTIYPEDWSGFRDYGSDVANLVVAASFIRQEIKRLIASGADTTRTSRNPQTQPYLGLGPTEYTE